MQTGYMESQNSMGSLLFWHADPDTRRALNLAKSVTENNCWAISLCVLLMFFTASSSFFKSRLVQLLIRFVSALMWSAVAAIPIFFIGYWLSHDALLSPDALIAIWQTNPAEAVEYVSFKGTTFSTILIVATVLLGAWFQGRNATPMIIRG